MTVSDVFSSLTPLSRLNSWARVPYEQRMDFDCVAAVYAMKRRVIVAALAAGICSVRFVRVPRKCKTCSGTGTYVWKNWNDECDERYEACRRCGGTGDVVLRFIETRIGEVSWHTPAPKCDFLPSMTAAEWEKISCETDWTPEQPGVAMDRRTLIRTLDEAERAVFSGKRLLRWIHGNPFVYRLHLGLITECFVCGREAREDWHTGPAWGKEIYRPGLKWKQCICSGCEHKAERWPIQWPENFMRWDAHSLRDLCPRWTINVPLPELAQDDSVRLWMQRRGLVVGLPVPNEICWYRGLMIEPVAHVGSESLIRYRDSQSVFFDGYSDGRMIRVPADELRGRNPKLLTGAQP